MFPNPVYRTTVPPGERWALRHLPFYARWFRFIMGYTGIAGGTEPYRIDPDYTPSRRLRRQRGQRHAAASCWRVGSALSSTAART